MALKTNQIDTIATAGGIDTDDTAFTLTTGAFDAKTTGDKVPIIIDGDSASKCEVLKCYVSGTAVSSCVRAQDGTTAVTHSAGAAVWLGSTPSAIDYYLDNDYTGALKDGTGWDVNIAARAYLDTAQSNIANTTATKVLLDEETYDLGSNFASNKFTVPTTGTYLINAQATAESFTADKTWRIFIYVNNASVAYKDSTPSVGTIASVGITTIQRLTANDYVELFVYHNVGDGTPDLTSGTTATFMEVQFLGT